MFEWLLLSNYCAIVAQTIYVWRSSRGNMGLNNVSKIGEQIMKDAYDETSHTFTDPESWPSISNVTTREVSRCVDTLRFPLIIRRVIMEWAEHGREIRELYELSKRYEWEMGFIPYARFLVQREVDDDILTSIRRLIEFCERYLRGTTTPQRKEDGGEEAAFDRDVFADGVDGIKYRSAISNMSLGWYVYPDIRMIHAYLGEAATQDGEEGQEQGESPSSLVFFQSDIIRVHFAKCIPFLPIIISKSGHNVQVLVSMLHDVYCSLNVRDTVSLRRPRVISHTCLDSLFGSRSKYAIRRRGELLTTDPRMIREGETIRIPLQSMFPADRHLHPPRTRAIHILSSVRLGERNDGVYCVTIERQGRNKHFALKVKIGTSPHYQDMLPHYRALEEHILGIPNEGYVHTYENVTWNVPFLDGGVNFTISEWIDGKNLGDMIREKKVSAPCCPYCLPGLAQFYAPEEEEDSPPALCREHRDIRMYLTILRSLYRMHCRGEAHLDILPQNVIVHETRGPILIDLDSAFSIPDVPDWRKYCLRDIRDASYMFRGFIYQQDFIAMFPLWDFDNPRPPHVRREGYKEDEVIFERIVRELRWNRWNAQVAFPENLFILPTLAPATLLPPSSLSLTISEDLLLTRTSSDVEFYIGDEAMLSELDITARHSLTLLA